MKAVAATRCERQEGTVAILLRSAAHSSAGDVMFGAKNSRIRTKPGRFARFARFQSFTLNILRANGVTNVNKEPYVNALNFENVLSYKVT